METAFMTTKQNYRQKRQSQKQNLLKKKVLFFSFLSFVLASILGYFLFFSPLLKIQQTPTFIPLQAISQTEEIAQKLEATKGKSLIFLNIKSLTKEFLGISPEFETVYFKRNFKNHSLVFTYKLKTPAIILCNKEENQNCSLADINGALFAFNEQFASWDKEGLPTLFCAKSQATTNYIKDISFLKASLENSLGLKIAFFKCQEEHPPTIEVALQEGWKILFNQENDLNLSLTKLKPLIEEGLTAAERANLEYIDLRFSKAYYK